VTRPESATQLPRSPRSRNSNLLLLAFPPLEQDRTGCATGLTFFDDDVGNFFSPHAKDMIAIFLLVIGKPLKRKPQ
jgi:hypothetical protein